MKHLFSSMSSPSTSVFKQIPVSQLCPGMYLVRIVDSWWKSPFFLHRRRIQSQEEVQLLIQAGIHTVEIDTGRGLDVEGTKESTGCLSVEDSDDLSNLKEPMPNVSVPPGNTVIDEEVRPSDPQIRERTGRLRNEMGQSLNDIFQGLKTGQVLPMAPVHRMAETLIEEVSEHPVILTEVMLLDRMKAYDHSLYSHVLDVATLSLLVGMQLNLPAPLLHELAVAGLLHDVGFLRLPANVVKDPRIDRTFLPPILRQHVNVGVALIRQHAKDSSLVQRLVGEHHEYVNGSGYPRRLTDESISEGGKLLGLVDYFDELTSAWGNPHWMPPALALRRIFQDVRDGCFPSRMGEALVRTLGVFPVGTVVKLSTGEVAVVASHQVHSGVKPVVLVVQGADGEPLDPIQEWDLSRGQDLSQSVTIQEIVQPGDVAIDWRAVFSQRHPNSHG